jgi:tRNA-dihydrouridine synthase A
MFGRAAYHSPAVLLDVDRRFYADGSEPAEAAGAVQRMLPYIAGEIERGTRLPAITRHMLGLFQGVPGARRWRQILTVDATRPAAGVEVVTAALDAVVAGTAVTAVAA